MKKTTRKVLDAGAKDWELYLERELPIFEFSANIRPYGPQLKKTTGFGFVHQLHHFKGKIGTFYRSEKEMEAADAYYAKLIESNDPRIAVWLEKEKEMKKVAKKMETETDMLRLVKQFEEVMLYNTVIPYRLFSAIGKVKNPDPQLVRDLENARSYSYYPHLLHDVFEPLFEKAGQKLGVNAELASLLTLDEFAGVFSGKKTSPKELQKRKDGCFFWWNGKKIRFWFGSVAGVQLQEVQDLTEVKGQTAWKGTVTGTVKIVNSIKNMEKFKDGDVLVSINTNPSLMPIIKKASAIVTDEGGVLCHAAIVSREFKIPCVIGTKVATKVFKDGDTVLVDATHGTVKRLNAD